MPVASPSTSPFIQSDPGFRTGNLVTRIKGNLPDRVSFYSNACAEKTACCKVANSNELCNNPIRAVSDLSAKVAESPVTADKTRGRKFRQPPAKRGVPPTPWRNLRRLEPLIFK